MSIPSEGSKEALRQAVEIFWETIPPFWHQVRAYIRQTAAEQFDISVEQFHILRHIKLGDSSVSELAEAKNISRPAVSQAVDLLVQRGFITRTTDSRDRRHVQLALTPAGTALLDAVSDNVRRWMMAALSPLSDEELQTLVSGMECLRKIQPE